eukprot:c16452_g1_i1 orf=694-1779(+)
MPPLVDGFSLRRFLQSTNGSFVRDGGKAIAEFKDDSIDKERNNEASNFENGGVASSLDKAAAKVEQLWPPEFVCPISNSVMVDPVIVASGQTYERRCIEAWFQLGQRTCMKQGVILQHFFLIPNVAVKTAIQSLAKARDLTLPQPPDPEFAMTLAKRLIVPSDEGEKGSSPQDDTALECPSVHLMKDSSDLVVQKPVKEQTEFSSFPNRLTAIDEKQASQTVRLSHSASGRILIEAGNCKQEGKKEFPLTFASKPLSCSADPHEERVEEERNRTLVVVDSALVGNLTKNLLQIHAMELEQTAAQLRKLSRQNAESRLALCQPDLLSALLPNLLSRYPGVQINSVAAMVNLSLENENKVKIV